MPFEISFELFEVDVSLYGRQSIDKDMVSSIKVAIALSPSLVVGSYLALNLLLGHGLAWLLFDVVQSSFHDQSGFIMHGFI